ncbi:hypothetical protein H4R26_001764 [Coemansia thaxteri]|uniref:Thioredoxin domain-containing protein n=1 Tax=Coemansia thaxteri TaxID=2663907 RepID=A0A9W8BFV1_9FUNG|nr:hypothetical protein H4R26_001764 [Coemansia thaxteri]KAJ2487069.1 hypothetical protein EV174_000751 [Coemansia sp. RSA 2320]
MKLLYLLSSVLAVIMAARNSVAQAGEDTAQYSDELVAESAAEAKQLVPKSDYVIELDRAAYHRVLKTYDRVFIEFYANWCAACHGLSPEFDAFAKAAQEQHPQVAIARADISKVEYLSSSYMVSMLPELVYIQRMSPGATPEVRLVSANFTKSDLLDYIGGGWKADKPVGGYTSLWCTPTNMCGHVGGVLGELVVYVDKRFNRFDIPPWTFMAIIVSVTYLVGQVVVSFLARLTRRKYRDQINNEHDDVPKPIPFNEYRSDLAQGTSSVPSTPKAGPKSPTKGSATKRAKGKKSKND